jgi:hypothetical protein
VAEDRKIFAEWVFILGEGRVMIHGLTDEPMMLTSGEARGLATLEPFADMSDAASKVLIWLMESGVEEGKAVEMVIDFAKKAQDKQTMSSLIQTFGGRF